MAAQNVEAIKEVAAALGVSEEVLAVISKNPDALKAVYVGLGGNAEDVAEMTLNYQVIDVIASLLPIDPPEPPVPEPVAPNVSAISVTDGTLVPPFSPGRLCYFYKRSSGDDPVILNITLPVGVSYDGYFAPNDQDETGEGPDGAPAFRKKGIATDASHSIVLHDSDANSGHCMIVLGVTGTDNEGKMTTNTYIFIENDTVS